MLDLADKYFKVAIINMFEEQQETLFKEIKGNIKTVSSQIENTIKGDPKNNWMKTLQLEGQ